MKKGVRAYILPLILAAALAFPVAGIAAEAPEGPEYSDEARAAAPKISMDGLLEQGEVITITVEQGEGAIATSASVTTQGLRFLKTDSGFSTQSNVVLMKDFARQTYYYKVTGYPGSYASFTLGDVTVLLSGDGEEEPAPPARWRQMVTGDPAGPEPSPTPGKPAVTPAPPALSSPVIVNGSGVIRISGDLVRGGTLRAEISTSAAGLEADVRTQGLEFLEVSSLMSSEDSVVLVNSEASQSSVVYLYRITAAAGELISIELEDVVISVDGQDVDGARSSWINVVRPGASANHSFGLSNGLTTQKLPSGRSAVVGLTASRNATTVSQLMRSVIQPASGRVVAQNAAGETLGGNAVVTSGCRLTVLGEDGSPTGDYAVIAVSGDVLGTGVASISQIVEMSRILNNLTRPTELQKMCADINQNDRVEIGDLSLAARLLRK